jgi:hypothetical protein
MQIVCIDPRPSNQQPKRPATRQGASFLVATAKTDKQKLTIDEILKL